MDTYGSDEYRAHYADMVLERMGSEPRPYVFLTPEWCDAYEKTLQTDERYKQVARNWEGSVVLVFLPDPGAGMTGTLHVYLDLWHGNCGYVRLVPENVGRTADYVLVAEYRRWEKIVQGELNVVKELATRRLRLTPFDFKKAVNLAAAAQAAVRLVELAGAVGARYPSDLAEDARGALQTLWAGLKTDFGL